MPICECGCGEEFALVSAKGVPKRFIPGHQFRSASARAAYKEGKRRQRVEPPAGVIADGLCQCGCGQRTPIASETNRARGWYKGYPTRYLHGHNRKGVKGPSNPLFKGRIRSRRGYALVYAPDHPSAYKTPRSRVGYVLEHRLVWEQANGRCPRLNEDIHHINGIKDDNRPENLVALTKAEHKRLHAVGHSPSAETRRKLSQATKRAHEEGRIRR